MYKTKNDEEPHCLECGEPLYGRTDKKFCNNNCRNKYHGHLRYVRQLLFDQEIQNLENNHQVLERMLLLKSTRCSIETLEQMGFRKEYATRVTKKGKHLEYRCFDLIYSMNSGFVSGLRRDW